jgi:hypothetical protein
MSKLHIFGEQSYELPDQGEPAVLIEDMTIEDYHDLGNFKKHGKNGIVSKTILGEMKCPALVHWRFFEGGDEGDKDHFNVGNAVHTMALEPLLFEERFHIIPEGIKRDKRTEKYKAIIEEAEGRKLITFNDHIKIKGMAKSLTRNRKAMALLDAPGKIEPSIIWTDPITGLRCRTRPDLLRDDGLIVNLKTAASAEPFAFRKAAFDNHYDMGAAMESEGYRQLMGKDPDNYVLLVIEKDEPYIVEAYDAFRPWDPDDMSKTTYHDAGAFRYRVALDKFAECLKSGDWPGYNDKIMPMGVPGYAMKQLEQKED